MNGISGPKLDLNTNVLRKICIKLMDHVEINLGKEFEGLNPSQPSHKGFNKRQHSGKVNGLFIDNMSRHDAGGKMVLAFQLTKWARGGI